MEAPARSAYALRMEPIVLPLHDAARDRPLPTTVYVPQAGAKAPLIVFGHGGWGHPRKFTRLFSSWGDAGYVVAAPTFPPYAYSWLRDGSFIADAMSRVGEVASVERFFDWVARIVERGLGYEARYTLDGERDETEWPHRQHDGWGLWLWTLRQHVERYGGGSRWRDAAAAAVAHLERVRKEPCFDWWEEREGVHAATLACIAAGLGDDLELSRAEARLDGSLLVLPVLGFGEVDVTPLISPGGGVHRLLDSHSDWRQDSTRNPRTNPWRHCDADDKQCG